MKLGITFASMTAVLCLLCGCGDTPQTAYKAIPDGIYVTDRLLYTSPYLSSYYGNDNGISYEIKGNTLTLSGGYLESDIRYSISEPCEIPFTAEEWDDNYDTFDGLGWQNGEINLSDHTEKYCFPLESNDIDGKYYLFSMDDELWYVSSLEIYTLKLSQTNT